jgi:RNA polymerase sigma factor (sigma-70 family)
MAEPGPGTADQRLEGFLAAHGSLIRRVVLHVAGSSGQAIRDDVQQDVLIALWGRLQREQSLDLTPSYVYKATVRETLRALRRQAVRPEVPMAPGMDRQAGEGPLEVLARRESREAIAAGLGTLAPERQRAVRLHLLGFTVDEIMRMCDWPYQKARNLIARGIADLRTTLRERGVE